MQKSTSPGQPIHFSMLLFDGFSNLCLANAVEPLRAANTLSRRALYDWRFVALSAASVISSSGLPVQPAPLTAEARGRYLFVMPSYDFEQWDSGQNRRTLRAAAGRFDTLVGLDTGSWLLAAAGLLDGYRATSHWDVLSRFSETFPEVLATEDRFVIDRDRATCGGATTTLELMLALIEEHHGATLALEVAALFMFGERAPSLDPLHHLPDHATIRAAAALMRRNLEPTLSIAEIAARLGTSQRMMEHVFRKQLGQSAAQLYRRIRLAEARRRIEQTRESVAEIASRSGYADPTAMTRAFKAEFDVTPAAIRRDLRQS